MFPNDDDPIFDAFARLTQVMCTFIPHIERVVRIMNGTPEPDISPFRAWLQEHD